MNKICTSIEQSKRLIELGIDINSSDMVYHKELNGTYSLRVVDNVLKYDIPAWSLSALLELMPSYLFEFERGIDLNLYPSINRKVWLCSYMPNVIENTKTDKFKQITHADSLVDAAFDMIVWLKENNYL